MTKSKLETKYLSSSEKTVAIDLTTGLELIFSLIATKTSIMFITRYRSTGSHVHFKYIYSYAITVQHGRCVQTIGTKILGGTL